MSTNRASTANGAQSAPEKTYFEQQRELLVGEIAQVNTPPHISHTPLYTAVHRFAVKSSIILTFVAEPRTCPPKHQQT